LPSIDCKHDDLLANLLIDELDPMEDMGIVLNSEKRRVMKSGADEFVKPPQRLMVTHDPLVADVSHSEAASQHRAPDEKMTSH
jgi:hypothetical protein